MMMQMRGLAAIVCLVLGALLVIQTVRYARVADEKNVLLRQIAELQTRGSALQGTSGHATTSSGAEHVELLRLRNQAAQLRRATNELAALRVELQTSRGKATRAGAVSLEALGVEVPREAWTFAGYATPEEAYQSMMFALSQRDEQMLLELLIPEEVEDLKKELKEKTLEQMLKEGGSIAKVTSFRVLERKELGPERVMLVIYASGEEKVTRILMQKVGEDWKVAGPANRHGQRD